MNGIIIIDKPKGHTSFDVIAIMRKLAGQRKIGHTGTLDPMATGVLPLLFGKATRAQSLIPDTNKEYIAEFQLGIVTDTQDITGAVLSRTESNIKGQDIQLILPEFTGEIMQLPPMYSAVQKDGKRLYDLARKGIEIERDARPITIHKLELLSFDEQSQAGRLVISCSKGTYIRTLCQDIGEKLGVGATLTGLRRTIACNYSLDDAITLDEARVLSEQGRLSDKLRATDSIFSTLEKVAITDNQTTRFKNGGGLMLSRLKLPSGIKNGNNIRVYSLKDEFLGLGEINGEKEELSVKKLFCEV